MSASTRPSRPPFADLEPTVEWQVGGVCNYDCSYCIQSRHHRQGHPDAQRLSAIVDGLATLPGRWEVKISGGEPFAVPGFAQHAVPALMARTPHLISVLTNLSAPARSVEAFCRATAERLRIVSASLHLEFTDLPGFLERARLWRALRERHNPGSSFVVNAVLVPGRIDAHFAAQAAFVAEGMRYFPQIMKVKGGTYPYDARDLRLIERLTGGSHDPRAVNRAPSYRGLHCEAGAWYFALDQRGDAWVCRTGRRVADGRDDPAWLGNLAEGTFALRDRGGPCPYPICPCTVPANRGVVRRPEPRTEVRDAI